MQTEQKSQRSVGGMGRKMSTGTSYSMQTEQKSQRSGGGVGRKMSSVYLILNAD